MTIDQRELKALDEFIKEFIALKEKLALEDINRLKNMQAMEDTREFKDYLKGFPLSKPSMIYHFSQAKSKTKMEMVVSYRMLEKQLQILV